MKTIWQLTYETIPSNGEITKNYKSFAEAKNDIKELISQIHISPYTARIRENGIHKTYRTVMADFLDEYVSRKQFFTQIDKFPSTQADDYELKNDVFKNDNEDIDADFWHDEKIDELDDFEICLGKDFLSFEGYYEERPHLDTNMVTMDDETEEYYFEFSVDIECKDTIKELYIKLIPLQYWGTSSYPLLILSALENGHGPLNQKEIISYIESNYDTKIERKSIGRNIALLKALKYNIQHSGHGYFIPKKAPTLDKDDFKAIMESIKSNTALDDNSKRKLIDKLINM